MTYDATQSWSEKRDFTADESAGSEGPALPALPWSRWGRCLPDSLGLQRWILGYRWTVWVSCGSCMVAVALVTTSQTPELSPSRCQDPLRRYPSLKTQTHSQNLKNVLDSLDLPELMTDCSSSINGLPVNALAVWSNRLSCVREHHKSTSSSSPYEEPM